MKQVKFLSLGQPVGDLLTEDKLSKIGTSVESSKWKVHLAQQMGTSASSARYAAKVLHIRWVWFANVMIHIVKLD